MKQKVFRLLADLRFAIFILLLISFCSIAGTIIEQDQTIDYYKEIYSNTFLFGDLVFWQFLLFFGLDHIYKTWWFLFIIFVFD